MSHKPSNPNLPDHLKNLQTSLAHVESMMKRLNTIVNGHPHKTKARHVSTHSLKQPASLLEQLASPLLKGLFSNLLGSTGSSRTSQGQILADAAAAIARASKRNL